MASPPDWMVIRVGDPVIDGDDVRVPASIGLRVFLKVGPVVAEIGVVDGNDTVAVENLLRETADEMRDNRLGVSRE